MDYVRKLSLREMDQDDTIQIGQKNALDVT